MIIRILQIISADLQPYHIKPDDRLVKYRAGEGKLCGVGQPQRAAPAHQSSGWRYSSRHIIEVCFKALVCVLSTATEMNPCLAGAITSSKVVLG